MNNWLKVVLAGAVVALMAGPVLAAEGDVSAGQQKAQTCFACHGQKGNSANGQFPKLAGQHASYIYKQLQAFKSGKRQNPIMQGQVASLNDQDMKDLAAYFASQTMTIGETAPNLADKGRDIYRYGIAAKGVAACFACHGPSGLGNKPAAFPRIGGQQAQYIETQLKAYRANQRKTDPNAMMRQEAAKLSDDEIQAVASYITGLHYAEK